MLSVIRVTHMPLHCSIMEKAKQYLSSHDLEVFMREDPIVNPELLILKDKLASMSPEQIINRIVGVFEKCSPSSVSVTEVNGKEYLIFTWR